MITNYSKAWIDFKKTSGYKSASNVLKKAGIKQPHRDNMLQISFAAGWNATNAEIKDIRLT